MRLRVSKHKLYVGSFWWIGDVDESLSFFRNDGIFVENGCSRYKTRREAIQILRKYYIIIGRGKEQILPSDSYDSTVFIVKSINDTNNQI